jgi:acyl transferase domain-containing protein
LNYASFWQFLLKGQTAQEPLSNIFPDQGSTAGLPSHGAFLKNATTFDNIAFGVNTRDARVMSNSARRLMDLSFRALLDSGIQSRGENIGCFMSGNPQLRMVHTLYYFQWRRQSLHFFFTDDHQHERQPRWCPVQSS